MRIINSENFNTTINPDTIKYLDIHSKDFCNLLFPNKLAKYPDIFLVDFRHIVLYHPVAI